MSENIKNKANSLFVEIKQLQLCLRFAETFNDFKIVSALWRQLTWTHFKTLIYQDSDLKLNFYTQMCRIVALKQKLEVGE